MLITAGYDEEEFRSICQWSDLYLIFQFISDNSSGRVFPGGRPPMQHNEMLVIYIILQINPICEIFQRN